MSPMIPGVMGRRATRIAQNRRPFWLAASNFYVMSVAMASGVFFLVWGTLHDGGEEMPWIFAGIAGSGVLFGAVILREVILRKVRVRVHATELLERNLRAVSLYSGEHDVRHKMSIEQNAALLRELKRKSDAARMLAKYAAGHREVFEFCEEYLAVNRRELKNAGPGSPRIAALRRGKDIAEDLHHRHMLKWAEVESKTLFEEAQRRQRAGDKIESATRALDVVNMAADAYPDDTRLAESVVAIESFIVGIRVGSLIERAEKATSKGNRKHAIKLYTDALRQLDPDGDRDSEKPLAVKRIEEELEKLRMGDA